MEFCKVHTYKTTAALKLHACALFIVLGGSSNAVAASDLPQTGICSLLDDSELLSVSSIAWHNETAVVARNGMEEQAWPSGLRHHGEGFKLSLFYQDPITGPAEVVVFSLDIGKGTEYRIGTVSYDTLADETRVLSTISGFTAATCFIK